MKRQFGQCARKTVVRRGLPRLESLEERLPPGDAVLGGLWTGALLGRAAPFVDDDAGVVRAVSEPLVRHRGRGRADERLAADSVSSWLIGTENSSPDHAVASNQQQDAGKSPDRPTDSGKTEDPFTGPWDIGLFNLLPGDASKIPAPARLRDADGLPAGSAHSSEASAFSGGGSPNDELNAHSKEHFSAGHYPLSQSGTVQVHAGAHDLSTVDGVAAAQLSSSPSVGSPLYMPERSQGALATPTNVSSGQAGPSGPSSIWTSGNNGVIGAYISCAVLQAKSLTVPTTNSTGVTSSAPLLNGVTYTLVASGDFRVSTSPLMRGDAQYHNMSNPRSMAADGITPVGLKVVGARLLSSNWGAYHPHHVYRMQVIGQGQPIGVYYSDQASAYAQHQGSLSVRILQTAPAAPNGPSTTTCPSVTPPDCGDDQSLIDENDGADGGDACPDAYTQQPFRYFDGNLRQRQQDVPAPTPITIGTGQQCLTSYEGYCEPLPSRLVTPKLDQDRAYTNNPGTTPNTYNGPGTVILQQPFLQEPDGTDNTVVVVSTETSARFFDLSGGTYQGRFWVKDTLVHTGGEFVLTDTTGKIFHFNDFTSPVTNQRGQLNSMIDQAGNTMTVTRFPSSDPNAGKVQEQQWMIGSSGAVDSFLYTYIPSSQTNGGLVQNVLRRRKPSSTGAWTTIRQVAYTYYDGTTTFGNLGNLQTATTQDAAGNSIDAEYYRYYKPGDPLGFTNGLKYVFNPQSYARAQAGLAGQQPPNNNLLTAADTAVAPYADNYFEYNAAQLVTKEVAQAAGSSSSSTPGLGTFTYQYFTSTATPTDLANNAAFKTVETLPDNNTNTVYANYNGQVMLKVFTSGSQQWITYFQHDQSGHRTMKAYPSAVSGFDEEKADLLDKTNPDGTVTPFGYLNDHTGRIELADYFSGTTTAGEGVPGNVNGYLMDTKIEQGKADPAPALRGSIQYFAHTADPANGGATVYPVAKTIAYRNGTNNCTDASNCEETDFSYSWLSVNNQTTTRIQSRTVQQPVALATQNGPAAADVETEVYDNWGRVIWSRNSINATGVVADGYIFYTEYDPQSGGVVKTIEDVDMTKTMDFQNAPPGWTSPSGARLHLITKFQVDALGRQTKRTDPAGTVSYKVYFDANHESRTYPGWYVVDLAHFVAATTGPIMVSREDRTHSAGFTYRETATASTAPQAIVDPSNPNNLVPTGGESILIGDLQTLKRSYVSQGGQVVNADAYFSFAGMNNYPADQGTLNVNFYRNSLAYDVRGRPNQRTSPTNTVVKVDFDPRSRPMDVQISTLGTAWTTVVQYVYDQAAVAGSGGVGDGNLTQVTQFPNDGSPSRIQQNFFDFRDRLVASKQGVQGNGASENNGTHRPIYYLSYDNLNEVTAAQHFDGDGYTLSSTTGLPVKPAGDTPIIPAAFTNKLRAQTKFKFDNQQRLYQVNVLDINQNDGTLVTTATLNTNLWYDHRGNLIKRANPGGLVSKGQYDGAGRLVKSYATDGLNDTGWADAGNVNKNNVLAQTETQYDVNSNPNFLIHKDRFHDDATDGTAIGELGTPTTSPKARVSYVASYYDLADRLTSVVDAGTYGAANYPRPGTPDPRTNPVLRTDYAYNAAGWLQNVTDPRGLVTRTLYDPLARTSSVIEAYDGSTPPNPTNTSNRTTNYSYDGSNHLLTYTALLPGSVRQTTQYSYGVTQPTSGLNSNDLLATVTYPGQSSPQIERYTYNALGEAATMTDRNATSHSYFRDVLGRLTSDQASVTSAQVDTSILRLDAAYDTGGRASLFTSYADTAGTTPRNQVQRTFNGLGQLTAEYQAHGGLVNPNKTPNVQYAYSEMTGGNHSRLVNMTYPNLREVNYNYTAGTPDDSISRLTSLSDSSGTLESYSYLGLATAVTRSHPLQPGTRLDLTYVQPGGSGDGGDQYVGLDRFGRVVDQHWLVATSTTSTDTDHFVYGYDADGNRLYRANQLNHNFDELYHKSGAGFGYDNFNQLTDFVRGPLSASQPNGPLDTVSNPNHSQNWQLDPVGNWTQFTSDATVQTRANNLQNQITSLNGANVQWYDANGNTITDDRGTTYKFDAWNRLVSATAGSATASYTYDALGRRITENRGGLNLTDLYYSAAWQVLEERSGSSTTQYVWSPVYVDALIERDSGGQRLYVQQDANWNVTSLVDSTGSPQERYAYDPYGQATVVDPSWGNRVNSLFSWLYLHQGGRLDSTSGLYYFRNRDYSPTLGRWMGQDPLRYGAGDSNLYGYVSGAPSSNLDPTGLGGLKDWWNGFCEDTAALGRQTLRAIQDPFGDGDANDMPKDRGNPLPSIPSDWPDRVVESLPDSVQDGLTGPIGPWSQAATDYSAATADAITAGLTTRINEGLGTDDMVNHNSGWYTGGEITGTIIGLLIAGVDPCAAGGAAGTGVRAISGLEGIGDGLNAIDNFGAGNYGAAILDAAGALGNLGQLGAPCFAAGTPLLTPNGHKAIEEFKPGDLILSAPDADASVAPEAKEVEQVSHNYARLLNLHVGGRVIRVTSPHPFYVRDQGWRATGDLQVGDLLRSHDGRWLAVEAVTDSGEEASVYNLRIAQYHTYFVGAADWGFSVWSHNSGGGSCGRPGTRGHSDHQLDVAGGGRRQAESLAGPGERVVTEGPVQGHSGIRRRADNQVIGPDGRTRVVIESERRPRGRYHQERVEELEGAGIEVITRPIPPRR